MTSLDERAYKREWYRKNAARLKPRVDARRAANRDTTNAIKRDRRKNNKEQVLLEDAAYREKNRERVKANSAKYRKKNPKKTTQAVYKSRAKRYLSDPEFRMQIKLKAYARRKIRNGPIGTFISLFGCVIGELRQHIERQWLCGMSWDNYGVKGWHIDHIRPIVSFDLSDPEQQKMCFHWTNLQPLWAEDNIRKGAKWDGLPKNEINHETDCSDDKTDDKKVA